MRIRRRSLLWLAAAVMVTACGDGNGGPVDPGAARLEVVSGNGQSGIEGLALPMPVTVRLVDPEGRSVPDVTLAPRPTGGGSVLPLHTTTNRRGEATFRWTLGPASTPVQELDFVATGSGATVTVEAGTLPRSQADVVILTGAAGPIRGMALIHDAFGSLEVVHQELAPDTLVLLQPRSDSTGLVVFPTDHALELRWLSWTPGPDTVRISLRPLVVADLEVWIFAGPYAESRAVAEADLERTARLWEERGFGIRLGEVTWVDRVEDGKVVRVWGDGLCTSPAGDHLEVHYVHFVNGSDRAGYGCAPGRAFMTVQGSLDLPYLLAHELGHVFSLEHRSPGMMSAGRPTRGVSDGEIFQMNFDAISGIPVLLGGQPEELLRRCFSSRCLPRHWSLGDEI